MGKTEQGTASNQRIDLDEIKNNFRQIAMDLHPKSPVMKAV